jgi:DNA ligase-1
VRHLAGLYDAIDRTTSTLGKLAALRGYFQEAPPADAAWALYFLTGRRLTRLVAPSLLWQWALEESELPPWLFEESYAAVGDLAETIALLLGRAEPASSDDLTLARWMDERLLRLRGLGADEQRGCVVRWWRELDRRQLYLLGKLLTGELRVGVSQTLVLRALAEAAGLPRPLIAHRLMGSWEPTAAFFTGLFTPGDAAVDPSRPYPFYLASPIDRAPETLGAPAGFVIEWKWDGIRAQLIRRAGQVHLWSRGEELITDRFPEIRDAALGALPDGTVLDGEVLAFEGGRPLPFARLQRRIGRLRLSPKVLAEAPAVLVAFDLLEQDGKDLRELPIEERRARMLDLVASVARDALRASEAVVAGSWPELAQERAGSRARGVEGLMLKRRGSPYRSGRPRGDWWKWKIDPFTIDAVLLYAQPGHGRRAGVLTDYTFALWEAGELVPIAKAYSGMTNQEIDQLDRWIRAHTRERFGPVRAVEPVQVFELAFEAIARSSRHRSGVAVRFPRIARWRTDKQAAEADTLDTLRALLPRP